MCKLTELCPVELKLQRSQLYLNPSCCTLIWLLRVFWSAVVYRHCSHFILLFIWTRLYLLLVLFLVQSQMLLFAKNTDRHLAAIAVKLLIFMLSCDVCVQIAPLWEAPLTVGTFELVMLYVLDPVVFVQDTFGAEYSWTKRAFESNTFMLWQFVLFNIRLKRCFVITLVALVQPSFMYRSHVIP